MPKKEFEIKLAIHKTKMQLPDIANPEEYQQLPLPGSLENLLQKYPPNRFFVQEDAYFQHPCYDMRDKDYVLRRRSSLFYDRKKKGWQLKAEEDRLTWKGPANFNDGVKSREESEFPSPGEIWTVLKRLGFVPALSVKKHRWTFPAHYKGHELEICLDAVQGLGIFLEVEIVLEESDSENVSSLINGFLVDHHLEGFPAESLSYADLLSDS